MSFAETYSAATASIVVSPCTTGTSCIGPQVVGVIAPENVPVPVAPAPPAKSVSSATARMPPTTNPGRSFTWYPPGVSLHAGRAQNVRAGLYPDREEIELRVFRAVYAVLADRPGRN